MEHVSGFSIGQIGQQDSLRKKLEAEFHPQLSPCFFLAKMKLVGRGPQVQPATRASFGSLILITFY